MKKIFLLNNYVKVIYDGTNERLYPVDVSQLSEFTDTFIIENRVSNQPKDTQVSFSSLTAGQWFKEDGTTAWTVDTLRIFFAGLSEITNIESVQDQIHGYFNIKTDVASPTETIIIAETEDTYVDIAIVANATEDKRPQAMSDAQASAFDSATLLFNLEGLTTDSFGNVLVDFDFDPDEDEGEITLKLLFNNNLAAADSTSEIESIIGVMTQGADDVYSFQQSIQFPISAEVSTNAVGDAGACKLQIKSTVSGVLQLKSLTYFLYK